MPEFQTICQTDEIPAGEARMFVVGAIRIGVFRIGDEFFALDDRCPHAGASLAHGLIDGDTVCCRIHHWRFCIRDGTHLGESVEPRNIRSYPLRVVGQSIEVEVA